MTVADRPTAETIAGTLVSEALAKCVNIVNDITSIFHWENKVQKEQELLLIVKTKKDNFASMVSRIKELHPYTVPEIIALPIVEGYDKYLDWLGA